MRFRFFIYGIGLVLLIISAASLAFMAYQSYGKSRLEQYAESLSTDIAEMGINETYHEPTGQLIHKGQIYEYNDKLINFLVMGIDSRDGIAKLKRSGFGGNADMIALVVLDEEAKSIKMIHISRNTIVPVQTFDTNGIHTGMQETHLALQYAYGDGREGSIRLMEHTISSLLHGIPIHGAGAFEMQGVVPLNEAVGGVTISVIEDLTEAKGGNAILKEGATIHLEGELALSYVRARHHNLSNSNTMRMARQKQYVYAFFEKVKNKTRENLTFPLTLYEIATDYVLTTITADQISYLSTAVLGLSFNDDDIFSIPGQTIKPGYYEEFIIDEEELVELIVKIFYRSI